MPWCLKLLKSRPHSFSLLIDTSAFLSVSMSQSKLNYHVETGFGKLPSSSLSVMPSWIIFNLSTLFLIALYYRWSSGPFSNSLSRKPGNSVSYQHKNKVKLLVFISIWPQFKQSANLAKINWLQKRLIIGLFIRLTYSWGHDENTQVCKSFADFVELAKTSSEPKKK